MSEENETIPAQRKGFVSPLQKAQAGIIGGGKSRPATSQEETKSKPTDLRASPDTTAGSTQKPPKVEETHFRQTIWMPKPLKRRLKLYLAHTDENITSYIIRLIEQDLAKQEKD